MDRRQGVRPLTRQGGERSGTRARRRLRGEIVVGSLAIIGRIAPELWPSEPRPRAQVDVFLDWFERVWMHPLGVLFTPGVDEERRQRAGTRLGRSLDRFEALLDDSAFLFGELTVADVAAYPFLKYATDDENPDDDYEIHHLMRRYQSLDGRPGSRRGWVACRQLPQA